MRCAACSAANAGPVAVVGGAKLPAACPAHWALVWETWLLESLGLGLPEDLEERWTEAANAVV